MWPNVLEALWPQGAFCLYRLRLSGTAGMLAVACFFVFAFVCTDVCQTCVCVYDRSLLCRCGIWHLSSVWTFPTMMPPICLWHIQPPYYYSVPVSVFFFFLNSCHICTAFFQQRVSNNGKNRVQHAIYILKSLHKLLLSLPAACSSQMLLLISSQMCDCAHLSQSDTEN